jgi:hypothetical protein
MKSEASYLYGVGFSSVKRYPMGRYLPSSTKGKDNRRVEMAKIALLYRTNLPYGVKTRPWHIRANRLPKPLKQLQLLLLTEQKVASGQTLKLKDEFRFFTSELLLDLGGHPIEAGGDLLLIST